MAKLVSKTYGDALFEIAAEAGRMDALWEEAEGVRGVLRENAEISKLMHHPKIVKEEKIKIIEELFKGRISDELVGLLRMIVDKGHFGIKKDRHGVCDGCNGAVGRAEGRN